MLAFAAEISTGWRQPCTTEILVDVAASNPRHLRPALRQRAHPPRPPGRVHPDRHLGALPEAARATGASIICADDTHGTAIMIRARQEGAQRRRVHRRDAASAPARLRRLRHRVRQLRQHPQRREPRAVRRDLGSAAQGGPGRRAGGRRSSTIRRPACSWPTASCKGTCPNCGRRDQYGDNCEQVRQRPTAPTELINPAQHAHRARRRSCEAPSTCSSSIEQLHGFLDEWTQIGRAPAARGRQLPARALPGRAAARLGHLAAAPYFGFEIPDSPGKYLYVWFDAPIGYMASTQQWCDRHGREARRLVAQSEDARSTTSSARTSPTSTRCSGRRCSRRPGSACRRRCTSTAS